MKQRIRNLIFEEYDDLDDVLFWIKNGKIYKLKKGDEHIKYANRVFKQSSDKVQEAGGIRIMALIDEGEKSDFSEFNIQLSFDNPNKDNLNKLLSLVRKYAKKVDGFRIVNLWKIGGYKKISAAEVTSKIKSLMSKAK